MRRKDEILNLPISQLTDEEICKAAMYRMKSKFCALVYRGDDGVIYTLWTLRDDKGKIYWNKIKVGIQVLVNKVYTKFVERYGMSNSTIY